MSDFTNSVSPGLLAEEETITRRGLVLPDGVALMLDTALGGDKAASGTPGPDGRPRSKNLAVLAGTVRVMTTRRGDEQRVITSLGAVEYRYELSINEVIGDEHGAARTSYHLPITMSDAVCSRYGHLLQDGQRIALLGPLGMEEFYDGRFQRDAYDAGRRNWDIRLDVLQVQEIGGEVPDMAWVQLEGEVVERPRIFARQYGEQRGLVEHYAHVTLRYREVLAGAFGRAVRPVVKAVPVEVLLAADEEFIPQSDALLRPGNKVRIEGRLNPDVFRLSRAAIADETVQGALDRTRAQVEARNTSSSQRSGQPSRPPLDAVALERQVARAQQRLLTGRRVRVEVGYVELLHGEPAPPNERTRLIAEGEERRRNRTTARRIESSIPDTAERAAIQDVDTALAMGAVHRDLEADEQLTPLPSVLRPRKPRPTPPPTDESPAEMLA